MKVQFGVQLSSALKNIRKARMKLMGASLLRLAVVHLILQYSEKLCREPETHKSAKLTEHHIVQIKVCV